MNRDALDGRTALASATLTVLILLGFLAADDALAHWSLLPLFACGTLIGLDMIDWLRGRRNVFDVVGILGLLGYHFFFLAPLLHVRWDFWMDQVAPPPDWRDWLGCMALYNVAGLLIYRLARRTGPPGPARRTTRRIDPRRFVPVITVGLVLSACLQVAAYASFGGIVGYITAFEAGDGSFEGMGWIFVLSEKFPLLALIAYAVAARRRGERPSTAKIAALLLGYVVLTFLFGGLRGSRSNTIWSAFWAAGVIHFWLRPLPKRLIYAGLVFVGLFMYVYGFYKSGGSEAVLTALQDRSQLESLERRGRRGSETVILSDLARADVQAFILYRMFHGDYELAWGRTYVGAAALLVPRAVWPDRPPDKVQEGTQVQYGMHSYRPGGARSSRVYGLAGEFMLNFGPACVPFVYALLGLAVGRVSRLTASLDPLDARWLLVPFYINLCFVLLGMDSDNILFFSIKNGLMPVLVVHLGSVAVQRRRAAG